ncbi:MAG: MlaD family protein [Methyloceanibacter sp.]|jgi:phospholipid/cholesterol/gamma-HCH transport system substrate-binding protein
METRARYALIGLFMLAVILASFGFVYWLENKGGFSQRTAYRVRFGSSVSGLLVGAAVLFNGIRVGEVTDLALDPKHPEQVLATIAVQRDTPVRSDTQVGLESQGLTGAAAVTLIGGEAASSAVPAREGELPLLVAEPGATQDWTSLARGVLRKLDTILADNADNFHSAIANFNSFTDVLARNSDRIDGILAGLERFTGVGTSKAEIPVYDLTAANGFPPLAETPSWQLVVPEPSALLAINTDKLRVRPSAAAESTDIPDAKWTDNVPILLQEKVIQSFENAGYSRAVSRPRDGFEADYQLLLDIRNFSISTAAEPLAEIEFEAKVLGPGGKIIAARTFHSTAPASGAEAPAAAGALNEAFDKAVIELVPWAAGAINSAPPPEVPPQRT